LERVTGIEPAYAAWEAAVLPLNYTRNSAILLGLAGVEQSGRIFAAYHGRQVSHVFARNADCRFANCVQTYVK
jgi:hypothetical protein